MNGADVFAALDLPAEARVEQRIPKTLLVENGAPTAGDKRLINDGVERLQWHAAIKPSNTGVAEFRDGNREYLEIAVVRLSLRPKAKGPRLAELTHRAIPYPVVLLTELDDALSMTLVHKRWSQAEAERVVLDGDLVTAEPYCGEDMATTTEFLASLAIGKQARASLYTLYQGWIDLVLALQAARITGSYQRAGSREQAIARRDALLERAVIEAETASLRAAATKTTQLAKRADINLELQRLQARRLEAEARL